MSQAMQNDIDELRGRVFALEQHLKQLEPLVSFLTPEVLSDMQELFKQEPAEPKKGKR